MVLNVAWSLAETIGCMPDLYAKGPGKSIRIAVIARSIDAWDLLIKRDREAMNNLPRFTTNLLLLLFISPLPTLLPATGNIPGQTPKEEQQRQDETARAAARLREQQRRSIETMKVDRERLTNSPPHARMRMKD